MFRPGLLGVVDGAAFLLLKAVGGLFFRLYFGVRVVGRTPARGPFIVCANHASLLDALLIGYAARPRVRFMMTTLFRDLRGAGWFFRWNRVIFVREGHGNASAFKRAIATVRQGQVLGIFPEGGISDDGAMRPLQTGALALAERTGVPIVPIGIRGSSRALSRTARVPRPATITMRVGAPIPARDLFPAELPRAEALRVGAQRLGERILELSRGRHG